jgi:hypothetical protein
VNYNPRALEKASSEIEAAERAIARMQQARDFKRYEHEWRSYLNAIAKFWSKLRAGASKGREPPWLRELVHAIDSDPLLKYLEQARHADEHSIQEFVRHTPGSTSLGFASGSGYIERMTVSGGRITKYSGDPAIIEVKPDTVEVVAITNRGVKFPPPAIHDGSPFESRDPLQLGMAGLRFTKRAIESARGANRG